MRGPCLVTDRYVMATQPSGRARCLRLLTVTLAMRRPVCAVAGTNRRTRRSYPAPRRRSATIGAVGYVNVQVSGWSMRAASCTGDVVRGAVDRPAARTRIAARSHRVVPDGSAEFVASTLIVKRGALIGAVIVIPATGLRPLMSNVPAVLAPRSSTTNAGVTDVPWCNR